LLHNRCENIDDGTMTERAIDLMQTPQVLQVLGAHAIALLGAIREGAPTVRALARALGVSERTVHTQLLALEHLMLIHDDRGAQRSGEACNARRLRLACRRLVLTLEAAPGAEAPDRALDLALTQELLEALRGQRIEVLRALAGGACTLPMLCERLGLSARALQDHVRVLEAHGLIVERRRRGSHGERRLALGCRLLVLTLALG
jgi:DNA-binding transcriptional ArsR family regulator